MRMRRRLIYLFTNKNQGDAYIKIEILFNSMIYIPLYTFRHPLNLVINGRLSLGTILEFSVWHNYYIIYLKDNPSKSSIIHIHFNLDGWILSSQISKSTNTYVYSDIDYISYKAVETETINTTSKKHIIY